MGFRAFSDRDGRMWEVRDRSSREWEFSPGPNNPGPARLVAPPGYEKDPFEMSVEELQRLNTRGRLPPPCDGRPRAGAKSAGRGKAGKRWRDDCNDPMSTDIGVM